ncbi:MAG: hypothetical protein J0M07_10480 [Anaerolineae bacterium]|uniref:hypothetical protein n=1 Tax=Candidatus Flexifilum breve TaxID=3140694 RepID=UPI001AC212DC|nr:hypothetical protein [Chloroflexota bacterium]MBK9748147.1 hypothetical protein [Chloroflexota bacterium]MBN8635736.1 hypothetical protein [Anaerolineae bacterium]
MAIHEPKVYVGLTEDQICEHVSRHGHNAHKVVELPHATYENHRNSQDLVLGFASGSAKITIGKDVFNVAAGDRLNIPGNRPHSGVVGAEGIVYFVTQCENCTD